MPRTKKRSALASKSSRIRRVAKDALRPPLLFGTLPLIGDLQKGSRWAAKELEDAAIRRARRVGFID